MRRVVQALLLAASLVGVAAAWQPQEGRELLGTRAPEFAGLQWLNSAPLTVAGLKGHMVFIRFWLRGCPLCTATAPALNELQRVYGPRGLVVIGIHHPKSAEARDPAFVRGGMAAFGFTFPVAMDNDWQTLNRYWYSNGAERSYTSVSFLLDPQGRICWLHDGGELHAG